MIPDQFDDHTTKNSSTKKNKKKDFKLVDGNFFESLGKKWQWQGKVLAVFLKIEVNRRFLVFLEGFFLGLSGSFWVFLDLSGSFWAWRGADFIIDALCLDF
jgi:hypothetical protein